MRVKDAVALLQPDSWAPAVNNMFHRFCTRWMKEMPLVHLREGLSAYQVWDIEHVPLFVTIT